MTTFEEAHQMARDAAIKAALFEAQSRVGRGDLDYDMEVEAFVQGALWAQDKE